MLLLLGGVGEGGALKSLWDGFGWLTKLHTNLNLTFNFCSNFQKTVELNIRSNQTDTCLNNSMTMPALSLSFLSA